jgi:hypothetical protein
VQGVKELGGKKFNIARGESPKLNLQGGKTKFTYIAGSISLFTL